MYAQCMYYTYVCGLFFFLLATLCPTGNCVLVVFFFFFFFFFGDKRRGFANNFEQLDKLYSAFYFYTFQAVDNLSPLLRSCNLVLVPSDIFSISYSDE